MKRKKKKEKANRLAFQPLAVDIPHLSRRPRSLSPPHPLRLHSPFLSTPPSLHHNLLHVRAPPSLHVLTPASDVAQVQVGLLYAPVWRDVFRLVAFHVLLHGRQAGAVLQADGTLVGRGAVVGAQVLDHGRVVPGSLVAQLALEWLLT